MKNKLKNFTMAQIFSIGIFTCFYLCCLFSVVFVSGGVEILSKTKLERCDKVSKSQMDLNCTTKIVLNMAVPSDTSGGDASIVAEIAEVEDNSSSMQTLRARPVVTVNKSAVYALYELTYLQDVAFRAQELYHKTRKCEPFAGPDVVGVCARLKNEQGHINPDTEPICCPCGGYSRVPQSCGSKWNRITKGKVNTAHCVRFSEDRFHVFSIGQRSIGFNIRIEVKTESKVWEIIVGPENRTATSKDKFFRVNLIGDFAGYANVPSFENCNLVTPSQGGTGQQPADLGTNISMWMVLERLRFGDGCDHIGVSYKSFQKQPDFCIQPQGSCLYKQLGDYWDGDQNKINRNLEPEFVLQGKYQRINQHPNAGAQSFSIGITEELTTDLLIELAADDIEFVIQWSPGKILGITVPTFEALTQSGTAKITCKNIGELEASYGLVLDCSKGVQPMQEIYFSMKPDEVADQTFEIFVTTEQASQYVCTAILKDANFNETDRAECQFSTAATIPNNGSQILPNATNATPDGFFDSIGKILNNLWAASVDFITGKSCRTQCSGFFDIGCHVQYICLTWLVLFGLFIAIFPTALVLLWLLHEKGLFDPIYDWWEDLWFGKRKVKNKHGKHTHVHVAKHHQSGGRHYKHEAHHKRTSIHKEHRNKHREKDIEHDYHLHHVQKHHTKRRRNKKSNTVNQAYLDEIKKTDHGHHKHRKERCM